MTAFRFLVAAWLAVATTAAPAQTIYRCGNEYTRVPCSNGKSIEADSAVEARRAADARKVASSERRLADEMVRERRAREAATQPAKATSLGPAKAPAADSGASAALKPKKKAKAKIRVVGEGDFVAAVPKVKKKP